MRLMREEIFGPVAVVTPFDDLDDVVGWANDSPYGLAASVWTEGLSNGHRIAARLEAGTVWVNCHSFLGPELPKGGTRSRAGATRTDLRASRTTWRPRPW